MDDDEDVPLAWGSPVSDCEIYEALAAILIGQPPSSWLRVLGVGGLFVGFEIADVGSSEPPEVARVLLDEGRELVLVQDRLSLKRTT